MIKLGVVIWKSVLSQYQFKFPYFRFCEDCVFLLNLSVLKSIISTTGKENVGFS